MQERARSDKQDRRKIKLSIGIRRPISIVSEFRRKDERNLGFQGDEWMVAGNGNFDQILRTLLLYHGLLPLLLKLRYPAYCGTVAHSPFHSLALPHYLLAEFAL